MRRIVAITLAFLLILGLAIAQQSEQKIKVIVFYGRECPYCHKALTLLEELSEKYPLEITKYEVYHNTENLSKFEEEAAKFGVSRNELKVPFIIIGEKHILGYKPDAIKKYIGEYNTAAEEEQPAEDLIVKHFLFGEINLKGLSLPAIAVILGLVDGFNPCAMWVLVYLISVLLATKDRKRIWLIVGTFVFASGVLYFLFMTAWLNLFLLISFVSLVQVIIGVMAIAIGAYHLKEFFTKKELVCKVTPSKTKEKIMDKINAVANRAIVPATFLGIVVLAFTVNLFEFFCSAGIPAVFTKILTMSNLPAIQYYLYILLYDIFYMLDDILLFGGAAITLEMVDISSKYVRIASAIGGIVLLLLGIALIFFPQALIVA